jgi:hypothetical protein
MRFSTISRSGLSTYSFFLGLPCEIRLGRFGESLDPRRVTEHPRCGIVAIGPVGVRTRA